MAPVMAGSPRVVTADVSFTWDGVPWRLQRGQVIDVPPDSELEKAIGADMLIPLSGAEPAAEVPQAAGTPEAAQEPEKPAEDAAEDGGDGTASSPRKARSAAKNGQDGGSQPAGEEGGTS